MWPLLAVFPYSPAGVGLEYLYRPWHFCRNKEPDKQTQLGPENGRDGHMTEGQKKGQPWWLRLDQNTREATQSSICLQPQRLRSLSVGERQHEAKPLGVKKTRVEPQSVIMAIHPRHLTTLCIRLQSCFGLLRVWSPLGFRIINVLFNHVQQMHQNRQTISMCQLGIARRSAVARLVATW